MWLVIDLPGEYVVIPTVGGGGIQRVVREAACCTVLLTLLSALMPEPGYLLKGSKFRITSLGDHMSRCNLREAVLYSPRPSAFQSPSQAAFRQEGHVPTNVVGVFLCVWGGGGLISPVPLSGGGISTPEWGWDQYP